MAQRQEHAVVSGRHPKARPQRKAPGRVPAVVAATSRAACHQAGPPRQPAALHRLVSVAAASPCQGAGQGMQVWPGQLRHRRQLCCVSLPARVCSRYSQQVSGMHGRTVVHPPMLILHSPMPPTTPPTIAPMGADEEEEEDVVGGGVPGGATGASSPVCSRPYPLPM